MPSIQLLAGCPLQGSGIDVPPSAAVSTVLLCVTDSPREGIPFLAHGVQNSSSPPHWPNQYSAQNQCDCNDITYLRLHFMLIDNG